MTTTHGRWRWVVSLAALGMLLTACSGGGGGAFSLGDDDHSPEDESGDEEGTRSDDDAEDEEESFRFELTDEERAQALEEVESVIDVDASLEIRTEVRLTGDTEIATSAEVRVGEIITEFDGQETDVGTLLTIPDDVLFDFDDDSLRPDAAAALDQILEVVEHYEDDPVEVIGHTDSVGSAEYNQGLSERRANSVVAYLVAAGVDDGRITAVGRGLTEPVADNETEEGRQQNRRVEILLVGVFPADG